MNINAQDLQRLSLTERLRHHVRRGDHRAAIHLALELHDDESARRSAWLAIQGGAAWRLDSTSGCSLPIYDADQITWTPKVGDSITVDIDCVMSAPLFSREGDRWALRVAYGAHTLACLRLNDMSVPVRWSQEGCHWFVLLCAEAMLPLFERYRPSDQRARRALEDAHKPTSVGASVNVDAAGAFGCIFRSIPHLKGSAREDAIAAAAAVRIAYFAGVGQSNCASSCLKAVEQSLIQICDSGALSPHTWETYSRDVLEPLLLRCLLLPIDELTTTSLEVEVAR